MTLFDLPSGSTEPTPAAPSGPLVRVRLLIAYDGTPFRGFATTPGQKTVASALGEALGRVLRHDVALTCAGRTDAGVHAAGQVAHFDSPLAADEIDLHGLQRSVNRLCAPAIVVRAIDVAPHGFDARHSALARSYRYTVVNRPVPDPFLHRTSWHVAAPLDLRAMTMACDPLIGEHDFSSFCRKPDTDAASLVRRVRAAGWVDVGDGVVRFDVTANAFCQQMVRSIVGTLVEVGLGKRKAGEMAWTIRARDRAAAGTVAPPQGLMLWEVEYPPEHARSDQRGDGITATAR